MLSIDFTDLMVFIYDCSRYGRRVYTRLSRAMGAKSRLYMFHVNVACEWRDLVYPGEYTGGILEGAMGSTFGNTLGSTVRITLGVRWVVR